MTKQMVPDIEQVSDCSEGRAGHNIDKLEMAGLNNGSVANKTEEESESEIKADLYSSKPSNLTVLEARAGQAPAFPMASLKCVAQAATGVKHVHEDKKNCKPFTSVLLNKNNVENLASRCSNTTKASSSNFTIVRPFALATHKRAQERPASASVPNCSADIPQDVKTLRQKFFVAKSSHTDNIKPSVSHDHKVQRNATGFSFRLDERAKKRKEFYSKLQEKFNAQEKEKTQVQAMTEKENEEALKVLRRSLTFKASPMPSFYQEGPPKVEVTKIPTTQAKSPKFSTRGRRGGSESVSNGVCEVKISGRLQQHMNGSDVDLQHKRRESITGRLAECSLVDSFSEQSSTSNAFSLSSSSKGDEENAVNHKVTGESELMINYQQPSEGSKAKPLVKGTAAVAKASFERHDRHQNRYGNNVLTNCANNNKASPISSSRPNKMKPKVQPLPYEMKEDVSPPMTVNKTTKKERLKALTPYFRKRESIGSAKKSAMGIPAKEFASDLDADNMAGIK